MIKESKGKKTRQSLLELSRSYRAPRSDALGSFYVSTDLHNDNEILNQVDSKICDEISKAERSKFSSVEGNESFYKGLRNSNIYFFPTTKNTTT